VGIPEGRLAKVEMEVRLLVKVEMEVRLLVKVEMEEVRLVKVVTLVAILLVVLD
jgi:hypothetical protein